MEIEQRYGTPHTHTQNKEEGKWATTGSPRIIPVPTGPSVAHGREEGVTHTSVTLPKLHTPCSTGSGQGLQALAKPAAVSIRCLFNLVENGWKTALPGHHTPMVTFSHDPCPHQVLGVHEPTDSCTHNGFLPKTWATRRRWSTPAHTTGTKH